MTLPTITTRDGRPRLLGLIPSRLHCPTLLAAVPPMSGQIIPEHALVEYDDWPECLPVLDQGGSNACSYFAAAQALMYGRYQNGQAYVALDPLCAWIAVTGGENVGTNLLEAGLWCKTHGVPPMGTPAALVVLQAKRFRFEFGEKFTTWPQILSEVARRRAVVGSVCVGDAWMHLDDEGVPGVTHGQANHAVLLGGGLRKSVAHGWMIRHVGSWGRSWGWGGFGWYTEDHFDRSYFGECYGVQAVTEDLAVDVPPPVPVA